MQGLNPAQIHQQGVPLGQGNSLLPIFSQNPVLLCHLSGAIGPDLRKESGRTADDYSERETIKL